MSESDAPEADESVPHLGDAVIIENVENLTLHVHHGPDGAAVEVETDDVEPKR